MISAYSIICNECKIENSAAHCVSSGGLPALLTSLRVWRGPAYLKEQDPIDPLVQARKPDDGQVVRRCGSQFRLSSFGMNGGTEEDVDGSRW